MTEIVQTSQAQSIQSVPEIFSHDSLPFNATMGKWLERYWVWVASIPDSMSPREDTTGKNCGTNQNGPVWFLDPPVGMSKVKGPFPCEIPEGKAIFAPLLVGQCDKTVLTNPNPTDSEISECAKKDNQPGNTDFAIDGKSVVVVKQFSRSEEQYRLYRTTSDFFDITWVENNKLEAPPGTYRSQADGYTAIVKPLSLGEHNMTFNTHTYPPAQPVNINVLFKIKVVSNQSSVD
ncbi:MAG TPA: hypothetical protein VIA09_03960 [Nitrososphaeraceae archaeon]